jgi:hypothetical protein
MDFLFSSVVTYKDTILTRFVLASVGNFRRVLIPSALPAGLGGHFAPLPLRFAVAVALSGSGRGLMVVPSPGAL